MRGPYAESYSISRSLDPIFAIGIGLAAAGVRIRREERDKGHSMNETVEAGKRRLSVVFTASSKSAEPREGVS